MEKEMKHTAAELKQMQSLPLEAKIIKTKQRIREWYDYWDGDVYVSFSGGKDSTVLLDLVRQEFPNVPAVFVDTGLEFPEIKAFVKTFDNVIILRPKMSFRQVIDKYGYPVISKDVSQKIYEARSKPDGTSAQHFIADSAYNRKYPRYNLLKYAALLESELPISHKCCLVMKKSPVKSYEHKTGNKPFMGMLADESRLRTTAWMQTGCNAFEAKRQRSNPLAFWTEQDILQYIKEHDLRIADVYGDIICSDGKFRTTGAKRTGCVFCMFGAHLEKSPNRFELLKKTHPQLWEYCMKPWDEGGLGLKAVCEQCGIKTGAEPHDEQISLDDLYS